MAASTYLPIKLSTFSGSPEVSPETFKLLILLSTIFNIGMLLVGIHRMKHPTSVVGELMVIGAFAVFFLLLCFALFEMHLVK